MFDFMTAIPEDTRLTIARVLLAVLVFLGIWVLQRIALWVFSKSISKANSLTGGTWQDDVQNVLRQPIAYLGIAIGLILGAHVIGFDATVLEFVNSLARTLVIISLFVALFKVVDMVAFSSHRIHNMFNVKVDPQLMPFLQTAAKILIFAFAMILIVQEWDYNVSGLIAGLGLGGLAFSLAAQDTLSNLFGFTTIVSDRPFNVGEFIVTPDVTGIVEKVGVRSTVVRRLDQALVNVPNSTLASSVITNWSRLSQRWIEMTIGLTYSTSADQMEKFLERIESMLKAREAVQPDSVQVMFDEFADSSLNVLIRCYVNITDWYDWKIEKQAINLEIMRIVDDLGLSMAFPSQSVYLETIPPSMKSQGNGHTKPSKTAQQYESSVN